MEQCIIHIGYHKSASTFLQRKVFPSLLTNYLFFSGPDRKYLDMVESESDCDAVAIHDWINSEIRNKSEMSSNNITVLSHEELSGHPHGYKSVSPYTVANNLKKTFPKAKILIIIRNQFDYITSLYTFRVAIKGYESRSFDRFITEEGEKGLWDHLEYHRLIEYYQKLFGRNQVLALPMEMLNNSPNEFLQLIFDFMGIQNHRIDNYRPINVSAKSLVVLSFWRPINYVFGCILKTLIFISRNEGGTNTFKRLRFSYYRLKKRITSQLNMILSFTRKIDIECCSDYSSLLEKYQRSNASLQKDVGIDLHRFGYPIKRE